MELYLKAVLEDFLSTIRDVASLLVGDDLGRQQVVAVVGSADEDGVTIYVEASVLRVRREEAVCEGVRDPTVWKVTFKIIANVYSLE